jgi:hypothetical protein
MHEDLTAPEAPAADLRADRLARLEAMGDEAGYFEPLGARHWALFVDDGPNLLVSFVTLEQVLAQGADGMPPCHCVARAAGWSHLCVIAEGETWYRDTRVYRYFDRLIDEGFFEDFDRVAFTGAGMGGHAACAFSVAAPGATVLAIAPIATLDPAIAGWDRRHLAARRLDWRSRFGYGPDMIEGAARVFVLCDPEVDEDAMHAALYRKPFVTRLDARHIGPAPEQALAAMDILRPLIQSACDGTLTAASWAALWRARRQDAGWLRNVVVKLIDGPNRLREGVFLRAALKQVPGHRRLRKRMEELDRILARDGLSLPAPRG